MRIYVSKPVFYLILVLILLLPLSKKSSLIFFGKRVSGTVTGYALIEGNSRSERFPGNFNVSIISFTSNGKEYKVNSPLNVVYDLGETITVIYDLKSPENNILLTFSALYSGYGLILAMFVMMIWMAFYLTFGSRKTKRPGHKPKPGNWKRLE